MNLKQKIIAIFEKFKMPLHTSFVVKEAFASGWAKNLDDPRSEIEKCLREHSEFCTIEGRDQSSLWAGDNIKYTETKLNPWKTESARHIQFSENNGVNYFEKLDLNRVKSVFANFSKPLHYTEVANELYRNGYRPSVRYPDNSVKSFLLNHSDFMKVGKSRSGKFILANEDLSVEAKDGFQEEKEIFSIHSTPEFKKILEQHEEHVKKLLKKEILGLNPFEFEKLVGLLFKSMGCQNVEVTTVSNDKGVDVRCSKSHEISTINYAVQVKHSKTGKKVSPNIVRELRGSIYRDQRGIIVTNSSLTPSAVVSTTDEEKHSPIEFIDGDALIYLLIKYEVGVSKHGELIEYEGLPDLDNAELMTPIMEKQK